MPLASISLDLRALKPFPSESIIGPAWKDNQRFSPARYRGKSAGFGLSPSPEAQ